MSKNVVVQKIKVHRNLGQKKFWSKNFGYKKNLGTKKFGVQKIFGPKDIWVRRRFIKNKMLDQNNKTPKKLSPKSFCNFFDVH